MLWFRPSTRSRPSQPARARKPPNNLFCRREPAGFCSGHIRTVVASLAAAGGQPRNVLRGTRIADANSSDKVRRFRLDQHRAAARGGKRIDKYAWDATRRVGYEFFWTSPPFGKNDLEPRRIAADAHADAGQRVRQGLLLGGMTSLYIGHVIPISAGGTGDDQIETADLLAFNSKWMPARKRGDACPIDKSPPLLADCCRAQAIGNPRRWLRRRYRRRGCDGGSPRDLRVFGGQARALQLSPRQCVHRLPGWDAQRQIEQISGRSHFGRVLCKSADITLNEHKIFRRVVRGCGVFPAVAEPNLVNHY